MESSAYLSRNNLPIPAFTSIEVAKKLRSQSENRYINEYMECELSSYKQEIERRFQKSTINKGYLFPRVSSPVKTQKAIISNERSTSLPRK